MALRLASPHPPGLPWSSERVHGSALAAGWEMPPPGPAHSLQPLLPCPATPRQGLVLSLQDVSPGKLLLIRQGPLGQRNLPQPSLVICPSLICALSTLPMPRPPIPASLQSMRPQWGHF